MSCTTKRRKNKLYCTDLRGGSPRTSTECVFFQRRKFCTSFLDKTRHFLFTVTFYMGYRPNSKKKYNPISIFFFLLFINKLLQLATTLHYIIMSSAHDSVSKQMDVQTDIVTLTRFILQEQQKLAPNATGELSLLLNSLQFAFKFIAHNIRRAELVNLLGVSGTANTTGDVQKNLMLLVMKFSSMP